MTKKSTTVARIKVTNESKLKLPQDVGGFTTNFRREAARSVGRIMSDEKKLKCFLELLKSFGEYAEDRYEAALVTRSSALAAKAAALKVAEAKALSAADSIIAGKRAHIEKLSAEVSAHDTKVEKSK
mgnify:CR=1 FL=1